MCNVFYEDENKINTLDYLARRMLVNHVKTVGYYVACSEMVCICCEKENLCTSRE